VGQSTEELNQDIEHTRQRLSRDVDELSDKVSPGQVAHRQKEAARNKLTSLKDKVMGSAEDARDSLSSAGDSASGSASDAMHTVQRKAEGNPLAAGVIAFGAGMLLSSLFPATETEQKVAREAKERAQPVMDEAKSAGQQVGQHLKDAGEQAAQEVGSTAKESAQHLKEEGRSSAQDVKQQASPSGS
jgi:ElaB/YqjD/DUF883 family membrane-anchored ribosome-binding protein